MPNLTVEGNIDFYYTDSGAVPATTYTTLLILHGHSFHSGIFQRLSSIAASSQLLRVICVNRCGYPGSTPYTASEVEVINNGSDSEREAFLLKQGYHLGLFVDGLIDRHRLPKQGGIAIAGWSQGVIFSLAFRSALNNLPESTQERLQAYVKSFILWDAPSQALGIKSPPGSWVPLLDESIPPEARGPSFGKWCSSYFQHGDLASRDFSKLNQRNPDPSRPSTVEAMSHDELHAVADLAAGAKFETVLVEPTFTSVLATQTDHALFNLEGCQKWDVKTWHIYGDANGWNVIYSAWVLEEMAKNLEINFRVLKGANHFLMWERPERALEVLAHCATS